MNIFWPEDPFKQFDLWYREASAQSKNPFSISLATAGANARPTVRTVYFRGIRENGFSFFTNYESAKGTQIEENDQAAILFYWSELARQVRVEGACRKLSSEESDRYFAARERDSQISAWASIQSKEISSDDEFDERIAEFEKLYSGKPVPRPPHWGGFALVPDYFEFWVSQPHRRHFRKTYRLHGANWETAVLFP